MTDLSRITLRLAAKALRLEHERNDKALVRLYDSGSPGRTSIDKREAYARELNLASTEIARELERIAAQ